MLSIQGVYISFLDHLVLITMRNLTSYNFAIIHLVLPHFALMSALLDHHYNGSKTGLNYSVLHR